VISASNMVFSLRRRISTLVRRSTNRLASMVDRTDGDIDALSQRIAHVRTWTFVANRPDWLARIRKRKSWAMRSAWVWIADLR
jgi:hypothetical protein